MPTRDDLNQQLSPSNDADANLGAFRGLSSGGYFFRAIPPTTVGVGWRVRTFRDPVSVGLFVARHLDCCLNVVALYDNGRRELLNGRGCLVPGAERLLLALLGDDEILLLKLFGVKLT